MENISPEMVVMEWSPTAILGLSNTSISFIAKQYLDVNSTLKVYQITMIFEYVI